MEKKKLKLTISGSSKKTINNIELAKSKANNSVVIEKKNIRSGTRSSFSNINNQKNQNKNKSHFTPKTSNFSKPSGINDYEKRKLAEQRATKRLRGENTPKSKTTNPKASHPVLQFPVIVITVAIYKGSNAIPIRCDTATTPTAVERFAINQLLTTTKPTLLTAAIDKPRPIA